MEYLVEFNSFIKKFKDAIKAREEVKIDPKEVVEEIKSILTFVDDLDSIDVNIKVDRGSHYSDDGKVTYIGDDKDFIYISVKHSSEDSGRGDDIDIVSSFNTNDVKYDILSMIDYLSSKYDMFKLFIKLLPPRKRVKLNYDGLGRDWVKQNTKLYRVGIEDFERSEVEVDAISILIILN